MRNQLGSTRIDFRYAPGDLLVPGLGDGFGRIFCRPFQADDQSVDEFAALLWRKLQGLVFKLFQNRCHDQLL